MVSDLLNMYKKLLNKNTKFVFEPVSISALLNKDCCVVYLKAPNNINIELIQKT